jgi:hypothetical protein
MKDIVKPAALHGTVEDEFQFAFECPSYSSIRNNANNILKNIFQMNITTDSKQNLLTHVMSCDDLVIIELFSSFISKCFCLRDRCLKSGDTP